MYNRFDEDIAHWTEHYNRRFSPQSSLNANVVKSILYQESRMGTSGVHLMPPPSDWASRSRHPIRSRFNIGQAIDSWGPQQWLMIREMAPTIATSHGLDSLATRRRWFGMSNAEYSSHPTFMTALREFFEHRDAEGNLMGTRGRDLHEDYGFWIRTCIRWLFVKYQNLSRPNWREAVRAYNGSGPRARRYRDRVLARVGSLAPFSAEHLRHSMNSAKEVATPMLARRSVEKIHVLVPEALPPSALLFDSIACDMVSGLRKYLESRFHVVALPGESLKKPPQPGDLVLVRALGEGDFATTEIIVQECSDSATDLNVPVVPVQANSNRVQLRRLTDRFDRLNLSTLILRPKRESHTIRHDKRIDHNFVHASEPPSEAIPSHEVGTADRRTRKFVTMPAHVEDWVPNAAGTGLVVRRVECRTATELRGEIPVAPTEIANLPVWRTAPAGSSSPGQLQAALDVLVYYPSGSAGGTTLPRGRFPLAIICMGNHNAYATTATGTHVEIDSFLGYSGFASAPPSGSTGEYLQEALAKIGVVSVSVSTNAANLLGLLVETRARLVVAAIAEMQRLASRRGSRYFRKIDFNRVALIGHSRGGDAVLRAVQILPRGVSIKALVQLAPTDITGLATGAAPSLPVGVGPTDYIRSPMRTRARDRLFHFIVWGSRDGDVSGLGDVRAARFGGPFRHYDRSSSQRAFHFWHGGTHNRFNRFWTDTEEDARGLINLPAGNLLSRTDQEARTVEAIRSLLLFRLHGERSESRLLDGRLRTTVAAATRPITGMWKFGRLVRTIDRFDDVRPTHNTMGGRNTTPTTGVFDEVTVANENPPNAGITAFQIPHIDRALRYSPAPSTGVGGATQPHWRTAIPSRFRRFDQFDVLTFRVTKRYLPSALTCTPPGCTPATRPAVRVRLFDADSNHTESSVAVLTAMPPIRRITLGGSVIDLSKYPYETWEVDLSTYSGIRLRDVRFVELHVTTEPGQPVYIDTLSLVKRP